MSVDILREVEGTSPVKLEVQCSYCTKIYQIDRGNYRNKPPKSCKDCVSIRNLNTDGTKTCSRCKLHLTVDKFTVNNTKFKGLKSQCKKCVRAVDRERFANNPIAEKLKRGVQARKSHLMKTYGLTIEEYTSMVAISNNCCNICSTKVEYNLHVDHCHETGVIRGLLCHQCNTALGMLKEDSDVVKKALEYMLKDRSTGKYVPGGTNDT